MGSISRLRVASCSLGLGGCELLVAPDNVTTRTTGLTGTDRGYAYVDFAGEPSTVGQTFYAQWVVLGQQGGGAYYATTAAQEFTVQ